MGLSYEGLRDFVTLPFKSSEEESVGYMGGFFNSSLPSSSNVTG